MKSVVVYESWFGNTKRIAGEIAEALEEQGEVELVSVDDPFPSLENVDPARRRSTDACPRPFEQALAPGSARAGRPRRGGNRGARLVGSAARGIARRLREGGYRQAAELESFFVHGTPGPLDAGELERAARWGKALASGVSPAA
jgi:hypothetical protein